MTYQEQAEEVKAASGDLISRKAAIDKIGAKFDKIYETKMKGATFPHGDFFQAMAYAETIVKNLPSVQPQYTELTPEEAASEIASRSTMPASYWLDDMIRIKQMGYTICRKKG